MKDKILFGKFFRYVFAALSSFVIDIALFTVFCKILKAWNPAFYAAAATVMARVISAYE